MSTFSLKAFKPCDKHFWELKRLQEVSDDDHDPYDWRHKRVCPRKLIPDYIADRLRENGGCPECRDWTHRHAEILAEQDAKRFVARWEKRCIKRGTAWRDRNTKELHFYPRTPTASLPQSRLMSKQAA